MPARSAIAIGGIARTKTQTVQHFRRMLRKYLLGQPVSAVDHADLLDLLARHPQAAAKVGSGVREFRIGNAGKFGSRCIEIVRADGTVATFSYLLCISPETHDPDQDILWAMRCEVADQTRAFFDSAFSRSAVFCEITGERLTRRQAHVDHIRPLSFQRLARDFLRSRELALGDVKTTRNGPHGPPTLSLADRELAAAWSEYHRAHAKLRIASKRANLKQPKPQLDLRAPTLF